MMGAMTGATSGGGASRTLRERQEEALEVAPHLQARARHPRPNERAVDLGGTGRAVTGKLTLPAGFREKVLWNFALVGVQVDLPEPKPPLTPAEQEAYNKLRAAVPHFTASVDRNGAFRIEDMPPDHYVLHVRFSQHQAGHLSGYRFSVPGAGGAEAGRPIDLGVLTLQRP